LGKNILSKSNINESINISKCILTAYDNSIANCIGISELIENKKQYAEKYHWDFICETDESFDKSRPAAFSKINFILNSLNKYDIVFWNDFDCMFMNFSVNISQSLNDDEYIGILEQKRMIFAQEIF
jgi:hypothetical protein